MKKEIISKCNAVAHDCFDGRDYSDFTVTGMLIKYHLFGLTWYRIKIFKPRVAGMYDGCFTTRARLNSYANATKTHLKQNLFEYKYTNGNPNN